MSRRRPSGSVDHLPSGRWRARYQGPDGHRHAAMFRTKADADVWLASQQTDRLRGEWVDPRGGRILLARWEEQWWATTVNLRPSTRVRDRGYLDRYVLPAFGDTELRRITQLDVRVWVAELATRLSPATVVKAYQLLAKLLGAAVDAGLIPETPCRRVPLPRIERQEMRFLTVDEVALLAGTISPRYRALVLVGAFGGLRIGEMAGLRRAKVDILRARVDIAEITVEVAGHLYTGAPKTRAGRRQISLPRSVADELGAHLGTWAGPQLVFTGPEGGPLRVPAWRRRFWIPAVTEAGLAPLRPHDLRHTAVALWIAQGANPKQVAARAGHTSVAFTLDRYGHLFPEADDALMTSLDAAHRAATAARDAVVDDFVRSRSGHAGVTTLRP
jgi:integrase